MPIRRVKMSIDILMDIPEFKGDKPLLFEDRYVKRVLSKSIKESEPNDLDFPIKIETPVVEIENRIINVQCLKIVEGFPEGWDKDSPIYEDLDEHLGGERTVDKALNKKYHKILQTDLLENESFCLCSKPKK